MFPSVRSCLETAAHAWNAAGAALARCCRVSTGRTPTIALALATLITLAFIHYTPASQTRLSSHTLAISTDDGFDAGHE